MQNKVSVLTHDLKNTTQAVLTTEPDTCPICGHGIKPHFVAGAVVLASHNELQLCFLCVRDDCHSLFLASYRNTGSAFEPRRVYPIKKRPIHFPESILEVSPLFVEIYNQAFESEALELNQLSGIGYRKAVEFLIKDFLSWKTPDEESSIKSTFLGKCISDYITDVNLREIAKRAVWLGNDETHYERKWEDKDISDLKVLIRISVNIIDNEIQTAKYLKEMKD